MFILYLITCGVYARDKGSSIDGNNIDILLGDFAKVPAGEFMMGSDKNKPEQPVHKVVISREFEMGKCEVTQEQWQSVMGNNPSYFKGKRLPVEQVSWDDAQKFISVLNNNSKKYTYRLPTEAEWEYACRAGTTGEFAGNLDAMGWYANNSGIKRLNIPADQLTKKELAKIEQNKCRTHSVGRKQPNAWGLYDMHGNVYEWCSDWDGDYRSDVVVDPQGPSSGQFRVIRGGAWIVDSDACRSAHRHSFTPNTSSFHVGFRLVRVQRSNPTLLSLGAK
jgi:formylglycine-generating enzyme required for sulfatase activity